VRDSMLILLHHLSGDAVPNALIIGVLLVMTLLLELAALASYLLGFNVTSYGLYPGLISAAILVLPLVVGTLISQPVVWALVVPVAPLWLLLVVERVAWGPLFLSWRPIIALSLLLAALGGLGWLARGVIATYIDRAAVGVGVSASAGTSPGGSAQLERVVLLKDVVRGAIITAALLAQGLALLYISLKVDPLPFLGAGPNWLGVLQSAVVYLISLLLPWCALLAPSLVAGALARQFGAAVLLAVFPFWLLMVVYMLLFAPSWFLDLTLISNLAERTLFTLVILGMVGAGGWWVKRMVTRRRTAHA